MFLYKCKLGPIVRSVTLRPYNSLSTLQQKIHSNARMSHIAYICHDTLNNFGWIMEQVAPNERTTPKITGYLFQQVV